MSDDLIVKSATLLDGLLAGVFVGSCMMEHAARRLPAQHWIPYNRAKDALYGPVMPVFFTTTLLVSAGTAWLTFRVSQAFATALLMAAGAITVRVNLPLNAEFRTWSYPDHPDDWADARRRWRNWNLARCVFAISAFSAAVVG